MLEGDPIFKKSERSEVKMYRKIKLFLSVMLTLQILSQANPSFAFDEDNLWGVYLVKLDSPGPEYIARFTIYPDGSYHFEDYPTGTYLTHPRTKLEV